jgi:hypothetical protein
LAPGPEHDSPAVTVTPSGRVYVVYVSTDFSTESIYLRTASSVGKEPESARQITFGHRAWRPRLAATSSEAVWMTWSGTAQAPKGPKNHERAIWLMQVGPQSGRAIRVSKGPGRAANPAIAISTDHRIHLVWEQSMPQTPDQVRIAYRSFGPAGQPETPVDILSSGPFDRRPEVLAQNGGLAVAWDRLVNKRPSGAFDPDYDIFLKLRQASAWQTEIPIDLRDGIQAAVSLAKAPKGGIYIAYHSSHRHAQVKWWTLREFRAGRLYQLASSDHLARALPQGVQQGAEYPALVVLPKARLAVFSRPSQGVYLQVIDSAGIHPPLDLTRRGWGARGRRCQAHLASDGSMLMVRRARHQVVLERFTLEETTLPAPRFVPAPKDAKTSRPALAKTSAKVFGQSVFFGDLHMHSAVSDGTGAPDEILARAWNRGLDFAALTDHDNIIGKRTFLSVQEEIAWLTDAFDSREGFSCLHAYEWTSKPLPDGFGHRNIYARTAFVDGWCSFRGRCNDSKNLFAYLKRKDMLAICHHTTWTGTDWSAHDENLQPLVEIISVHGATERPGDRAIASRGQRANMYATNALNQGLRFGFVGGSDAHGLLWHHGIGRKKNPWKHGLTGVFSEQNQRDRIFFALRHRKTIATSGVRMLAGIKVDPKTKVISYVTQGTRPITRFSIVRDGREILTLQPNTKQSSGQWSDLQVTAGSHYYYLRVEQGPTTRPDLVWTSPVFVDIKQSSRKQTGQKHPEETF